MEKSERQSNLRCRLALVLFFLLGVCLLVGGIWGNRQYVAAGFSQGNAFSVISRLAGEAGSLYQNGIISILSVCCKSSV